MAKNLKRNISSRNQPKNQDKRGYSSKKLIVPKYNKLSKDKRFKLEELLNSDLHQQDLVFSEIKREKENEVKKRINNFQID